MQKPNLQDARVRSKKQVSIQSDRYTVPEECKKMGFGKSYYVKTYGCQMNEHDSENMKAMLEEMGYCASETMEQADLVLLNTCAIRENAHQKVFGMIGRLKHQKQENPNLVIGVCGCMAQEEVVVEEIMTKYPCIDLVFGTHNLYRLPQLLLEVQKNQCPEIEVFSMEGEIIENLPVKRDNPYKAWVNIMYGCDKFCTYCIVPYTRGKQRSRRMEDILKEVQELRKQGYQEVTLLGQNVNAYGKDLDGACDMASLLKAVAETNIPRIRFVTSHPWDFNDSMISVIAHYPNIMPYIHLPLQSGSTTILKKMGRRYTKEDYLNLFHKLKEQIPNCAITTDIIVGFPSETEADFQETLSVVETCRFDSAYTFIYSPRVGTVAASLPDDTPFEVKQQRLYQLNALVNQCAREANDAYQDRIVPVLLEGESQKDSDCLMGYTDTMKLVNVKAPKSYLGQIVPVQITDVKTWSLNGKVAELLEEKEVV